MRSALQVRPSILQDEDAGSPLSKAFRRFSQDFDQNEKRAFANVTILDVLVNVRELDASHASSSWSRSLARRIDPFLCFLERHAKALDLMSQFHPSPSSLIWGIMRVLLEVCHSAKFVSLAKKIDLTLK